MPAKKGTKKAKVNVEEPAEVTEPIVEETPVEEIAPAKISKSAVSVDVLRNNGKIYIRSYSEKIHGEDFLELAKQFQGKHPTCTIVDSETIPEVIVHYREKEDAEKPVKDQNPDSPFVDKQRKFNDKQSALDFCAEKKGTISVR